jgi:tetratricopeptide (TPR) repeat protein
MPGLQLGSFTLERPLARGGMGEVWRARHASGTPAAIKVLTPDRAGRDRWMDGLQAEIRAVAGLDHPHIVWIHDAGTVASVEADRSRGRLIAGGPWFAMELADGGTLRDRRVGSWDDTRRLLASLLRALAHAHARGIVHRDIKPANVLFAGDTPKLTDFGMVFRVEPGRADDQPGGGTPAYMAPEQFEGERWDLGPWTDLYALGCVAYAIVAGRRPFPGKGWVRLFNAHWNQPIPVLEPRFDVPDGFEDWLHAMMAKHRHHRYQRAADALHALLTLEEPTTQGGSARSPGEAPLSTGPRQPRYPRPPLPHFREPSRVARTVLPVGLGLYGLRAMPFVGRNPERTQLWEALAAVLRDRRPRALVLRGPAGVGKSRLAQWLLERTHEVGAGQTFKATHAPLPEPLDGLAGLLARSLRVWEADRTVVQEALRDELAPRGVRDPGVYAALGSVLVPSEDGPDLSNRRRYALVTRAIAAMTGARPAVIWLDDVQWGHDAVDFADHLLTANDAPPSLVVLTVRDDLLGDEPEARAALDDLLEHERATSLTLAPLDRRAGVELIERGLNLRPELARRLHDRIQGNPMFAVELVGDWVERRMLVPTDAGFALADAAAFRMPDSVDAVWSRRLAQLVETDPTTSLPLAIAAVLGMEVAHDEWQAACAAARLSLPPDFWGRLQDLRLVRRDPAVPRYSFVHGTLREVVLEGADAEGLLPRLHRAAAAAVDDPGRKGTHTLKAGDLQRGVTLLYEAAESAAGSDMRASLRLLQLRDDALAERDVHHPGRIDGWLLASRVCRGAAKPADALEWADRALAAARHHDDREATVRALQCVCSSSRMLGRIREARLAIEAALELSDDLLPELRAETLYQCSGVLLDTGDLAAAERTVRRAMKLDQPPARRVRSGAMLGYLTALQGRIPAARKTLSKLLPLAESTNEQASIADVHTVLGEVERMCGRDDRAETHYRRALEAIAGTGIVAPACRANLAQVLLHRGDVGEARAILRQVQQEASEIGARLLILVAKAGLAACAADQRRWTRLSEHLDVLEADPGGLAAEDLAQLLRFAGTHAMVLEQPDLGRRALRLALEQYVLLGREEEAADLRAIVG